MRTVPSGLNTHVQGEVTTLALGWIITRKDGTSLRYTNLDKPSVFSLGDPIVDGTYLIGPMQSVNAIQIRVDMSVNNIDLDGFFIPNEITEADMVARLYESATVYIFAYNWANTSNGVIKLLRGSVGNIKRMGTGFTAEFRSLSQNLALNLCSLTSAGCRSQFGATGVGPANGCRYPIDPPVWVAGTPYQAFNGGPVPGDVTTVHPSTEDGNHYRCVTAGTSGGSEPTWNTTLGANTTDGSVVWTAVRSTKRSATVTAVTDRRTFQVDSILGDLTFGTGGNSLGGYFSPGSVLFRTGTNTGFQKRIGSFTFISGTTYEIRMKDLLPYVPVIGNTMYLFADCDKVFETCQRFGNYKNFRGEHKIPGSDTLFKVNSADGSKK